MKKYDVCLCSMPGAPIQVPVLALGILKASLLKENITCCVEYTNLSYYAAFNEMVKPLYSHENNDFDLDIVEFLFSSAAGLMPEDSSNAYYKKVKSFYIKNGKESFINTALKVFSDLKIQTEKFIDELAKKVLEYRPKIVGASNTFGQNNGCMALFRHIKKYNPDVITVMGGANCIDDVCVDLINNVPWLDYVFCGESDDTFSEFCKRIIAGDSVNDIHGLLKKGDTHAQFHIVDCLDCIPCPNFDEYFEAIKANNLTYNITPAISYECSRGCWWGTKHSCTFCALNGNLQNYRIKSIDKILLDLQYLNKRYHINRFSMTDNILSYQHIEYLIPELAKENYSLFFEIKTNITKKNVQDLRKAGVLVVQPGMEGLHTELLKLMKKGNSAIKHIELLKHLGSYGIYSVWNLLTCFPGEKGEWYSQTMEVIPFIEHLQPPSFKPMPIILQRHSEYYNYQEKYGLNLAQREIYNYIYPEALLSLSRSLEDTNEEYAKEINENNEYILQFSDKIQWWINSFSSKKRKVLKMTLKDDMITIIDTREIALQASYELTDEKKDIYLYFDSAKTSKNLYNSLPYSKDIIDSAVEYLLKHGLIIELDGKFLSLATETTGYEYISVNKFPSGSISLNNPKMDDFGEFLVKFLEGAQNNDRQAL